MRRGLLLAVAFFCLFLPSRNAEAAWQFGADETIHFLQDVTLKGANQEALFLGYLTKTQFVIAGVYITDEGYVLGVKGESKRYYNMPTGEELAGFQKGGFLPDPLPPYSLGFLDYFIGYSLWWAIAIMIVWWAVSSRMKKRKAEAALSAAPAAPPVGAPPPAAPPAGPPAA
jgi:hypothetical protein